MHTPQHPFANIPFIKKAVPNIVGAHMSRQHPNLPNGIRMLASNGPYTKRMKGRRAFALKILTAQLADANHEIRKYMGPFRQATNLNREFAVAMENAARQFLAKKLERANIAQVNKLVRHFHPELVRDFFKANGSLNWNKLGNEYTRSNIGSKNLANKIINTTYDPATPFGKARLTAQYRELQRNTEAYMRRRNQNATRKRRRQE